MPTTYNKHSHSNSPVTELMSASKKAKTSPTQPPKSTLINQLKKRIDGRDGLGAYISHPENDPAVVEYDDDFVVIRDKYPKASAHLLLIPRGPKLQFQHPLHALSDDPEFLSQVKLRVERLKKLVASELRRLYGQYSASDAPYQSALEELMSLPDPPPIEERDTQLPQGRDWSLDVIAGAHTHPSMNHLHIHVLSREMHSEWLKHKKHYLSFNTSFLVPLEDFPLDEEKDAKRFHPGDWPHWDMRCWRCGRNFGNQFKKLKEHIEEEFERWKRE